jgi:membrane-associated phospholipid phosphatase
VNRESSIKVGGDSRLTIHDSRFTIPKLPRRLFVVQLAMAALVAPWYAVYGLQIDWRTTWALPPAYLALGAAWWYSRRYAGHPRKFIFADVLLAMLLLLFITNIASPAQYLAIALHRPLIDDWLVRADAWLGIDVQALSYWTAAHPAISRILWLCYVSLLPQFLMPLVVLGLRYRDREGMWEYVFHFQFCLLITVAILAVFPAECPYTHLGFTPTIDQARVIRQIGALRGGTFHVIDFTDLEGLITMPSFHAAGAMMVTWAFRRRRALFLPLVIVNTGLMAATFMSGVHYFVDVVGSAALFALSVVAYRVLVRARAAAPSVASAPAWAPLRWPGAARTSTD